MACQRFVDGVIDHLIDQMVQPGASTVADIHIGPFADGLDAAKDLDVARIVSVFFYAWHLSFPKHHLADANFHRSDAGFGAPPLQLSGQVFAAQSQLVQVHRRIDQHLELAVRNACQLAMLAKLGGQQLFPNPDHRLEYTLPGRNSPLK
jgi:hypothetical protein